MPLNPLQILIEASVADPAREPEFLAELLVAPLFFHLPLIDDSARIRLVQFTRPDGLCVIPVFSDFLRANQAAQGNVRVATAPGRDLLEATRGATLMLDLNDTNCTLYPEEIAALLDDGVAAIAPVRAPSMSPELEGAGAEYRWLGDVAVEAVAPIHQVRTVWLSRRIDLPAGSPPVLVVILEVPDAYAERAIRALGLALAPKLRDYNMTVDATALNPEEGADPWPTQMGIKPHWHRPNTASTH